MHYACVLHSVSNIIHKWNSKSQYSTIWLELTKLKAEQNATGKSMSCKDKWMIS